MSGVSTTSRPEPVAPAPIDPRIRARRVEVQRDLGRRRLRRLAWTAGVLAIATSLVGIASSPLLDVDRVDVTGAQHTAAAAVVAASSVSHGDRMVLLGMDAAARRVARLPWIRTATVTRQWPGTVHISVVERVAVAALPAKGGGSILLDVDARQLEVVKDVPAGVLRVDTSPISAHPGASLDAERGALAVATAVPAILRAQVLSLRSADSAPTATAGESGLVAVVRLRDGRTVGAKLCTPERIEAKWLALVALLDQVDPRGVAGFDLCVPESPVVNR